MQPRRSEPCLIAGQWCFVTICPATFRPAGFLLADDSTCQAILCETGPGALCKKCQNPKDSTADVPRWQGQLGIYLSVFVMEVVSSAAKDQCIECNDGYQLTADFKCSPFTCSTGPNTGCKLCRGF